MQKKLLFVGLLSIFSAVVMAEPVSQSEAVAKARSFFASKGVPVTMKAKVFRAPGMTATTDSTALYYVINAGNDNGYAIIAGDDRAPTVLGYSLSGTFSEDNMPDNMRWWLQEYGRQIQYIQERDLQPVAEASDAATTDHDAIDVMLTTKWNQYAPYNNACPLDNGTPCVTGCTATAMAQVLYYQYQQHPNEIVKATQAEIPAYTTSSKKISVDSIPQGSAIDWANMRPTYGNSATDDQKAAVANLMFYCGASIGMNYTSSSSGGSVLGAADALKKYFGFSENCMRITRSIFSDSVWDDMLYNELANNRVVLYAGYNEDTSSGHAFVVNGYAGSGYYYINWGWGGHYDGKYLLSALTPGSGDYSYHHEMIIDAEPEDAISSVYAAVVDENGIANGFTMTFTYAKKADLAGKTSYRVNQFSDAKWYDYADKDRITMVVIDKSFADVKLSSTYRWFSGFSNMIAIDGLENLNTSMVKNMSSMFYGCSSLKSLDLSHFDTHNVTNMGSMFSGCSSLTSLDVSNFNTENVMRMGYMFNGCSSLASLDLGNFDTGNVTSMGSMFSGCSSLASLDLGNFNTRNVTNMENMFSECSSLTSLALGNFDTRNVADMGSMFNGCSSLTSLDMGSFNTRNVTDMSWMFAKCSSLTSLDLGNFDTRNVISMQDMFNNCSSLKSLNVSSFNTEKVMSMSWMFAKCSSLTNLDLSKFNTANTKTFYCMFYMCSSLTSLNVSGFNTENATNMSWMFAQCSSLPSLDISNFNTKNTTDISYMLYYCSALSDLNVGGNDFSNVTTTTQPFFGVGERTKPCLLRVSDDFDTTVLGTVSTTTPSYYYWHLGYFTLDDTATGIDNPVINGTNGEGVTYYNLNGVLIGERVTQPGIYIRVKGNKRQKVVVRP